MGDDHFDAGDLLHAGIFVGFLLPMLAIALVALGRKRKFRRQGRYGREPSKKSDLRSSLHENLGTLALDPKLYSDLENETVRKFGGYQLSKGVIRVGCDYLRKEMSADPFRLKAVKICAQSVFGSRTNERDRELFKELRQELCAIISEADTKLKQYDNGRRGHQ